MLSILRELRRFYLIRAEREFARWNETWNPPFSLLGAAIVTGLMGAALCLLVTYIIAAALYWPYHEVPMFWLLIGIIAFQYGSIPTFIVGAATGLAQALHWTRKQRLSGLTCVAGGAAMLAHLGFKLADAAHGSPNWHYILLELGLLYSVSLVWSLVLLIYGVRALNRS